MDFKELILNKIKEKKPDLKFETHDYRGDFTLIINKADLVELAAFLKEDEELSFDLLEDATAVDWARKRNRYTMVYHAFSYKNKFRIRFKADVDESDLNVDTLSAIWPTANWQEREVYDMFGISFNNHPDLRRMYMTEDYKYHPLRKEFPIMGIPGTIPLPKK